MKTSLGGFSVPEAEEKTPLTNKGGAESLAYLAEAPSQHLGGRETWRLSRLLQEALPKDTTFDGLPKQAGPEGARLSHFTLGT